MSSSFKNDIIRPLTGIEAQMANAHLTQDGTSQITTLLHIQGKIDPDDLKNAYYQLCHETPHLIAKLETAKLECEATEWFLTKSPYQEPIFHFEYQATPLKASDELLEEEVHQVLNQEEILMRLRLISSKEKDEHILCLTQHHAAADATTAKNLLTLLLQKTAQSSPNIGSIEKERYLSESLKNPQTISFNKEYHYHDLAEALEHFAPHEGALKTSIRTFIYDETFLEPLTEIAKKEGFSLNSLLSAVFGHAARQLLHLSKIPSFTAVSNRQDLSAIGCIIDVASIILEKNDVLEEAHFFHKKMQSFKENLYDNPTNFPLEANTQKHHLTLKNAISLCQGTGFSNSGRIEKLLTPHTVKILAYRSVTRRISGDMFPVFHFSFLQKTLSITIASPLLLAHDKTHEDLGKIITKIFQDLITHYPPAK